MASIGIAKTDKEDYEEEVYRDPTKQIYRKLIWNDKDEIVGATLMGKVEDIGVISNLIKNRIKISKTKRRQMVRSTIRYGDVLSRNTGIVRR